MSAEDSLDQQLDGPSKTIGTQRKTRTAHLQTQDILSEPLERPQSQVSTRGAPTRYASHPRSPVSYARPPYIGLLGRGKCPNADRRSIGNTAANPTKRVVVLEQSPRTIAEIV